MRKALGLHICLMLLVSMASFAQDYRISTDIDVLDINGNKMNHAWVGGLNNPMLHNIDLNGDGRQDVVAMEISAQLEQISFLPFVHVQGSDFRYAPEFEFMFENCDCFGWALLKDFNNDSLPDVFCGTIPSSQFKVYKGVQHCRDSISYVLHKNPLNFARNSPADTTPVNQNRPDIPAVFDVDYDGDVDIVASDNFSGRLQWYKNFAVENGSSPADMQFERVSTCWGHFGENDLSQYFLGDTTSFLCELIYPRQSAARHSGTTLMLFDANGDSLVDLIMGDVDSYRIDLLQNSGRKIEAFMNKAILNYPDKDSSVFMAQFLMTSFVDLNADGLKDLSVSPREPGALSIENQTPLLWYENVGIPQLVNFDFRDRTFIVDEMIDAGFESMPEFLDYNSDGLLDLVVSSRAAVRLIGDTIRPRVPFYLYENTGTASDPEFRYSSSTLIDFNAGPPFINLPEPAAGYLDNDGDVDLLVGSSDGRVYHYINQAASGPTADFQLSPDVLLRGSNNVPITFGVRVSPDLHDFDGDGDLDLFLGNGLGKIAYYENKGTPTSFSFELITSDFGKITIQSSTGDTLVTVRPTFGDFNNDGNADLIVGGPEGYVEIFTDAFQALQKPLSSPDTLLNYRFRGIAAPAVADLDGSGNLTFVIGNEEGGVILAKKEPFNFQFCLAIVDTTDTTDTNTVNILRPIDEDPWVEAFPNPARDQIFINFASRIPFGTPKQARLVNGLGQAVKQTAIMGESHRWNVGDVQEGMYFLVIEAEGQRFVQKFLIRR